jgi:hypothetical protein
MASLRIGNIRIVSRQRCAEARMRMASGPGAGCLAASALVVHVSVDGDARRARDKDRSNGEAAVETIVTPPKPAGSRQLISPLAAVSEIAPAKVLQGAVRLHGLTPTPEVRVASGAAASKGKKIQQQYPKQKENAVDRVAGCNSNEQGKVPNDWVRQPSPKFKDSRFFIW